MAIFKKYQKYNIVFSLFDLVPCNFQEDTQEVVRHMLGQQTDYQYFLQSISDILKFSFHFSICLLFCLMLHLISYIFGCQRRREEVALLLLQIPIVFFFLGSLQSVHECNILYRNLTRTVRFTMDQDGKRPSWPWTKLARDQVDHGPSWQEKSTWGEYERKQGQTPHSRADLIEQLSSTSSRLNVAVFHK